MSGYFHVRKVSSEASHNFRLLAKVDAPSVNAGVRFLCQVTHSKFQLSNKNFLCYDV